MELRGILVVEQRARWAGRKSIGGAVELRGHGVVSSRRMTNRVARASEVLWSSEGREGAVSGPTVVVARASEVLWSSEAQETMDPFAGRRSRKSIGGAVELRDDARRRVDRDLAPVARASEVLWSSEEQVESVMGDLQQVARASEVLWSSEHEGAAPVRQSDAVPSQEHRRCCGAPRAGPGKDHGAGAVGRKSIGGAVELRVVRSDAVPSGDRDVARASEVLWSSEVRRALLRLSRRRDVARASEVLWSSEH